MQSIKKLQVLETPIGGSYVCIMYMQTTTHMCETYVWQSYQSCQAWIIRVSNIWYTYMRIICVPDIWYTHMRIICVSHIRTNNVPHITHIWCTYMRITYVCNGYHVYDARIWGSYVCIICVTHIWWHIYELKIVICLQQVYDTHIWFSSIIIYPHVYDHIRVFLHVYDKHVYDDFARIWCSYMSIRYMILTYEYISPWDVTGLVFAVVVFVFEIVVCVEGADVAFAVSL